MYDCSKLISDFHKNHVRLTNQQRKDMKTRRDANVKRVKSGLADNGKPEVVELITQGGYAMKTMTQPPEDSDWLYDIDQGLVFEEADAKGPRTTRGWVRDALELKATNVKGDPEDKGKCVRIEYSEGYQCDFPVFRRTAQGDDYVYQAALHDEWTTSAPQQMNAWFDREVADKSPEDSGSYQLRRIVRLMKFFGKTWEHASSYRYPTGLLITALTVECFKAVLGRDDEAFYKTLKAIGDRSHLISVFADGVQISRPKDEARLKRLQEKAADLAAKLADLEANPAEHDDESARKIWKKVFRHTFFDPIETKAARAETSAFAKLSAAAIGISSAEQVARAKSAVAGLQSAGLASKPWGDTAHDDANSCSVLRSRDGTRTTSA